MNKAAISILLRNPKKVLQILGGLPKSMLSKEFNHEKAQAGPDVDGLRFNVGDQEAEEETVKPVIS